MFSDWLPGTRINPSWPGALRLHQRGRIYVCSRSPSAEVRSLPLLTREESIYAWFGGGSAGASVMVARLEEIDLVLSNQVYNAVFLRKTPGPNVWC